MHAIHAACVFSCSAVAKRAKVAVLVSGLLHGTLALLRSGQLVGETDQLRGAIGVSLNRQEDTLETLDRLLSACREDAAAADKAVRQSVSDIPSCHVAHAFFAWAGVQVAVERSADVVWRAMASPKALSGPSRLQAAALSRRHQPQRPAASRHLGGLIMESSSSPISH